MENKSFMHGGKGGGGLCFVMMIDDDDDDDDGDMVVDLGYCGSWFGLVFGVYVNVENGNAPQSKCKMQIPICHIH